MASDFKAIKQLLSNGATSDVCLFCRDLDSKKIVRGTSTQQTINLPFDVDFASNNPSYLVVTYKQRGKLILERLLADMKVSSFDKSLLYYTLLESETLRFNPKDNVNVQIKCSLRDESIIVSDVFNLDVIDSISDRKISTEEPYTLALEAFINDQELDVTELTPVIAQNKGTYKVRFSFDSTWAGFEKQYVFEDEYNHHEIIVENGSDLITIPATVIKNPGRLYIKIIGESVNLVKHTEYSNSIMINK